jgi:hypothetical protein
MHGSKEIGPALKINSRFEMIEIKEQKNTSFKNTCILCGSELKKIDSPKNTICDYCGIKSDINMVCGDSHYICNDCVEMPLNEFVKNECLSFKGTDPGLLAQNIMNAPMVKMHGPEHHYILPAVLATCIHNYENNGNDLAATLDIVEKRAKDETPKSCDFHNGNCGAAIGAGIFLKIYLGREKNDETFDSFDALSAEITANSTQAINNHGGPRCCKRDTYLTIEQAVKFFRDRFTIDLPYTEAKCTFSLRNDSCGLEECRYYNLSNSLV